MKLTFISFAYYNCWVLQLWESMLSLKTPNDEGITEGWNMTVKAVIEDRVRNVCVILTLCGFWYEF